MLIDDKVCGRQALTPREGIDNQVLGKNPRMPQKRLVPSRDDRTMNIESELGAAERTPLRKRAAEQFAHGGSLQQRRPLGTGWANDERFSRTRRSR